jgi:malate dehydrogenase (oxaloacetate-decarboxylating)(NADP+)
VRKAVELLRYADPMLIVDGEIAADDAVSPEIIEQQYPFSALKGGANVLIFPDLASANLATKLLAKIGGGEAIGPILMGMSRPVHVLQRTATVEEIANVSAIAVVDAQESDTHVHVSVEPSWSTKIDRWTLEVSDNQKSGFFFSATA